MRFREIWSFRFHLGFPAYQWKTSNILIKEEALAQFNFKDLDQTKRKLQVVGGGFGFKLESDNIKTIFHCY